MASAWQSKKRGRLAIHRPEGWRGTGGFWHSDLLGKVTGTLPGRPCVISDRHPGETAPSQPVFLTSSKKPLHINAVQFSFLPSRFIFPSYQKCHGNCSPGSNSPGRNRQVLPVFDPVGFCSFLRHIPKILGNLRESSRRLFWASEDNQQGEDSHFSGFPANPGTCPCPQSDCSESKCVASVTRGNSDSEFWSRDSFKWAQHKSTLTWFAALFQSSPHLTEPIKHAEVSPDLCCPSFSSQSKAEQSL